MKRFVLLGLVCVVVSAGAAAQSLVGKTLYVSTKTAQVKASTGFFARTRGTLVYGEPVTVLREQGVWVEIRSASRSPVSGWMKSAGLTARRITAGGSAVSASANELALAGKGFNEEVEKSYQDGNNLDYSAINSMEARTVSEDELYAFLEEGHLVTGE
jgi:SH3-like domain-containing protein